MEALKSLKVFINKRFEKHPLAGYIIYGVFTGFFGSVCIILLLLGASAVFGIYGRLDIDYKTWWIFIGIAAIMAVLVFIYGAIVYLPYKRKGNSLFRKEYTKGTSYKALHHLLISDDENEGR